MRRLLIPVVLLALALAFGVAAPAVASNRVPGNVRQMAVTLTFPPRVGDSRQPVRRTLTGTANVQRAVRAVDALQTAQIHVMCPMIMVLGPELTVVFKARRAGAALAEAQVAVTLGTHGSSGSSACFPIQFTSRGLHAALVGNSFVRLMGRLIGVQIS